MTHEILMNNAPDRAKDEGRATRSTTEHRTHRARQQSAIADISCTALCTGPLVNLFQSTTERVAAAMDTEFALTLELLPDRRQARLVAGVGWKPGSVGSAIVDTNLESQAADALRFSEAVIVSNLREDAPSTGNSLLHDHGIVSGITIIIGPKREPWGIFGTYSVRQRAYSEEDAEFLKVVAGLLWAAIDRRRHDQMIQQQLYEANAIFDGAPVGLCVLDSDFRYVRVNNRLAEINGLPAADHFGKTPTEVVPEIAVEIESIYRRVIESGEPLVDVAVHGRTPANGGVARDWLCSCIPFRFHNAVSGVNIAFREVTDQKHTERELRDLNVLLEEQLQLRAGLIHMLHDVATQVHEARSLEEAVQFILRRVAEFNGWSFGHAFLVPSDDVDRLVPLQSYYELNSGDFQEFREATAHLVLRRGEGLPGRALALGEPVFAGDLPRDLRGGRDEILERLSIESAAAFPIAVNGRTELVLEFFANHAIEDDFRIREGMENVGEHLARTVERLRAEAALRESEHRFRELAESVNQIFWVLDPNTDELFYVSPAWSRMIGVPASQLVRNRERWRMFIHPDDRERIDEEFQSKARHGEYDVIYRVVRPDGVIRWIHDVAVAVREETGAVRRIIGVAEDITDRRALEREIADAATHEQQRLSRDLHDSIGQELTGLSLMAAKLTQRLRRERASEAEAAATLVAGLQRTLQQVRRIARGLAPMSIETGGLSVALAQLAEQTRFAGTTDCVFHSDRPVTLQDPGVAAHLYRIAQEAVSNAVKHAQATTITITLSAAGGICELTVEDDGVGLDERQLSPVDGMGMRMMRYRANLIGARFRAVRIDSGGTRIICQVPLGRQSAAARP